MQIYLNLPPTSTEKKYMMDNWIKLEEKLPELEQDVLLAQYIKPHDGSKAFWTYWVTSMKSFTTKDKGVYPSFYDCHDSCGAPSHWKPIDSP